jgi:hypothetical protein
MRRSISRRAMTVLWPSFLVAVLAVGCCFSLYDPQTLGTLAPMAIYTLGFFAFWTMTALASLLTCYLLTVPDDDNGPL